MRFVFPAFLFALLAVAVPIAIHLFSFRRFTTVYFSNVSYLRSIKQESKKQSQLKQLLMLAARILAIVSLVFAFAQPYFPVENQVATGTQQIVTIYIDNSFSMNTLSTEGQLLEVAKQQAVDIATAYPTGTKFKLITNDMHPRHRNLFNREQLLQQITEVRPSSHTVYLSDIYQRIQSDLTESIKEAGQPIYYLSDFQQRLTDLQNFGADTTFINYLLPIYPSVTSNLYIDSLWMERPAHKINSEELLYVKIINHSDQNHQNLPVKLFLNDTLRALGSFDIAAGEEKIVELRYINLNAGVQLGYAEISDYPVTYDNTYYFGYTVQPGLKALAISGQSNDQGLRILRALFDDDDFVELDEMLIDQVIVSRLSDYNAIFLLNAPRLAGGLITELHRLVENGSSLIFFPDSSGEIDNYNQLLSGFNANLMLRFDTLQRKVTGIEYDHPVYAQVFRERTRDADLPLIHGSFVFSPAVRVSETPLLWFGNNAKALSTQSFGNGNLSVFSFPLSETNIDFVRHILFVPTLYSLAIHSLPYQKNSFTLGTDQHAVLAFPAGEKLNPYNAIQPNTGQSFIPQVTVAGNNRLRIALAPPFEVAGNYRIESNGQLASAIALNYDRRESDFSYFNPRQLNDQISSNPRIKAVVIDDHTKPFSEILEEITRGQSLWKWFLLAALIFMVTEALISRFWNRRI